MRAVVYAGAGGNEVVRIEERADPAPSGQEVLVAARFAGLNPADLEQRRGRYPAPPGSPPDIPGLEVAGTVEAVGDRVLAWKPGDRVFGLVGGGGLADRVLVHERHVVAVPEGLSEEEAAAVPEAFITAHDAIRSQAALATGETLLVHGAAGGVGHAAVQIGAAAGALVLATTRSHEGAAFVETLGAEPLDDEGFAEQVAARTDARGADVILELVGASHFPANLDALAVLGRIVVVGLGAGAETNLPLSRLMGKRATLRGTVLRARPLEQKAQAVQAFAREVVPHLASGRIRPRVDSTFPLERAAEAFERLEGRGKRGKVLIEL